MALSLQSLNDGDMNYIPKHNQNYGAIAVAVDGLSAQILAAAGAAVSEGAAFVALFGTQAAIVGAASFLPTVAGTSLNVDGGYFWRPSSGALVRTLGTTVIAFVGVAAGTYYLQVDATGSVTRSDTAAEAVYSVVWTGSAFGTITRLAVIVYGAADWLAAQPSAALGATYTSLDARLEAGEALIAGAAPLASPAFTGVPTAPTAAPGTNTTQLATTAFTAAAVAALVDASPGTLDTLNELAAALGDDPNFAATLTTALGLKAPLASPAFTGVPAAPTAAPGTSTTQLATTAFVGAAVAAAGGGDVVGPGSATTNHVATFNGTTGKLIQDSGLTLSGANTGDETGPRVATLLHAASAKTTLVDADEVNGTDSAASFGLIRTTWTNVKAFLKTYFDTQYAPLSQPIVVVPFFPGVPIASQLLGIFPAPAGLGTITFAAALAGAAGKALTAATAQTDIDVRKNATTSANGTSVGTIRFAAAGTVPTFIAASGFTLTSGADYLSFWAPATPDATLANFAIALFATR